MLITQILSLAEEEHQTQAKEFAEKVKGHFGKHLSVHIHHAPGNNSAYARVHLVTRHPTEGKLVEKPIHFQARFANHAEHKANSNISVDPTSTNTVDDAIKLLKHHISPTSPEHPRVKISRMVPELQEEHRAMATYDRRKALKGHYPLTQVSEWKRVKAHHLKS